MSLVILSAILSASVLVSAQYGPEGPEGPGHAYYDEPPPPQYGNQPPQPPPPPPPRQPNAGFNQPHAGYNAPNQGFNQNQGYHQQEPLNNYRVRTTTALPNDTFTLPEYYHSITTTKRTVKVNRRTYPQQLETLLSEWLGYHAR